MLLLLSLASIPIEVIPAGFVLVSMFAFTVPIPVPISPVSVVVAPAATVRLVVALQTRDVVADVVVQRDVVDEFRRRRRSSGRRRSFRVVVESDAQLVLLLLLAAGPGSKVGQNLKMNKGRQIRANYFFDSAREA